MMWRSAALLPLLLLVIVALTTGLPPEDAAPDPAAPDLAPAAVDVAPEQPQALSDSTRNTASVGRPDIKEMLDKPLWPVYHMSTWFLSHMIQWKFLTSMGDEINIYSFETFLKSFETDYDKWMLYFVGFMTCICAGVLFFLGLFFTAIFLPCCRCCGNCGGKVNPKDGKHSHRDRVGCGVTVAIFMCIIILGIICLFVFNERLQDQMAGEDSAFDQLGGSIVNVNEFLLDTAQEVNSTTYVDYVNTKAVIFKELYQLPSDALKMLDNATGVLGATEQAVTLVGVALPFLSTALPAVDSASATLQREAADLDAALGPLKSDTLADLTGCVTPECDAAQAAVNQLGLGPDYSQVNVSAASQAVSDALASPLPDEVAAIAAQLAGLVQDINTTVYPSITSAEEEANKLGADLLEANDNLRQAILDLDLNNLSQDVEDLEDYVVDNKIDVYVYWGIVTLGGVLSLIVFATLVGLLHGASCRRPKKEDSCSACSWEQGARWLLVAVAFTLIFFWILIALLMVMFAAGGALYTEVCRNVIEFNQQDSQAVLQVFDGWVNESLYDSAGFPIQPFQLYGGCDVDLPLYQAAKFEEKGFNISEVLDDQLIQDAIDEIKSVQIDLPDVILMNNALYDILDSLGGSLSINFSTMQSELATPVVTGNYSLYEVGDLLEKTGQVANVTIQEYYRLADNYEIPMTSAAASLSADLKDVEEEMPPLPLTLIGDTLNSSQTVINTEGDALTSAFVNATADEVGGYMTSLMQRVDSSVRNDVGRCRPLFDSMTSAFDAACVYTLYPLNGFWFSLGWILFFLFICFVMSLKSVTLYRKTEAYHTAESGRKGKAHSSRKDDSFKEPLMAHSGASASDQMNAMENPVFNVGGQSFLPRVKVAGGYGGYPGYGSGYPSKVPLPGMAYPNGPAVMNPVFEGAPPIPSRHYGDVYNSLAVPGPIYH